KSVQADFTRSQLSVQARRFIDDRVKAGADDIQLLAGIIELFSQPLTGLPESVEDWPEKEWFKEAVTKTNMSRHKVLTDLIGIKEQYAMSLQVIGGEALKTARDAIQNVQQQFQVACLEKGIQPGDITRLQELEELRQGKLKTVEERQQELRKAESLADGFPATLKELHSIWTKQFDIRQKTAKAIEDSASSQTVRITMTFMSDKESFKSAWRRLEPKDGRGKLARHWEKMGDDIHTAWQKRQSEVSPWETLEAGREDPQVIPYLYGEFTADFQPAFIKYIDSEDVRPIWEAVRISRISDGINVELLRNDGTSAGTMSGTLSKGQRNTVLLNLILARGTGPLIIDQPEDELDSSFIYKCLVEEMRVAKEKRQLIVATHSANLPVNADAELIYILEARDGRGKSFAQGGLDRSEVTKAVLDVMEGSEQAFKRRSEKYCF
ncbi:MAG: AAA family ATPase, partial [Nitrosospira sp.]